MCRQLLGPSASMPSAWHVSSVQRCHRSGYSYYRQPWWTYVWRPLSFRLFILLSIVLIIINYCYLVVLLICLSFINYNFFWENFNLWRPLLMIAYYHQTKTPISFWYRRGLNPISLIQLLETLPIELTGTHKYKL